MSYNQASNREYYKRCHRPYADHFCYKQIYIDILFYLLAPFIKGAQTAQDQIANGTVLGGRIGVTQGYLTYTYFVMNPTNDTAHKVIVDAGNGQVLHTSEGKQIGSGAQSMFELFGQGREHKGFGGGGGFGPFGGFWHNK